MASKYRIPVGDKNKTARVSYDPAQSSRLDAVMEMLRKGVRFSREKDLREYLNGGERRNVIQVPPPSSAEEAGAGMLVAVPA